MGEIINKVAVCEYYASIYEGSSYADCSQSVTSQVIKKASDALSDFYAAVFIFIVKAKIYFSELISRSKSTADSRGFVLTDPP